jgi:hypothetical protein
MSKVNIELRSGDILEKVAVKPGRREVHNLENAIVARPEVELGSYRDSILFIISPLKKTTMHRR